jgi:hypothetical protein
MPTSVRPIAPIQTRYADILFRSRLEARWAMVFDGLRVHYEYEPEGYRLADGSAYLPDYYLPQVKMFAEVKPSGSYDELTLPDEALRKAVGLALESLLPVLILDGVPRDTNYWAVCPDALPSGEWDWVDVLLTEPHRYHLSERRFFMDTGTSTRVHLPDTTPAHPAIRAARSARFEGAHRT